MRPEVRTVSNSGLQSRALRETLYASDDRGSAHQRHSASESTRRSGNARRDGSLTNWITYFLSKDAAARCKKKLARRSDREKARICHPLRENRRQSQAAAKLDWQRECSSKKGQFPPDGIPDAPPRCTSVPSCIPLPETTFLAREEAAGAGWDTR